MHYTGPLANPETWVAIAFVIFVVLFGRKLWQALAGMLDKRADAVRAELAEAARLKHEAQAMLDDARQRREAAIGDAQRLLDGAMAEAHRLAEAAAADATASARRRERMAIDRISAAEKAAVTQVRVAAADIAAAAAQRIIGEGLGAEVDGGLIDHAISTLPASLARRAA